MLARIVSSCTFGTVWLPTRSALQQETVALSGGAKSTIGRAGSAVASAAGAVGQGAFGVASAFAAALQLRQVCECAAAQVSQPAAESVFDTDSPVLLGHWSGCSVQLAVSMKCWGSGQGLSSTP